MSRVQWLAILALVGLPAVASAAQAPRGAGPYIGYVYPAGGQQGTTVQLKVGGQGVDDAEKVLVTGAGVSGRVVECYRRVGPQDMQLLGEQRRLLLAKFPRGKTVASALAPASSTGEMMMDSPTTPGKPATAGQPATPVRKDAPETILARIEARTREYVNRPACSSIAGLVFVEVKIASDAPPGERELRLATPRGVSTPLAFYVGQVPETCRKPMLTAAFQVLGKEESALRKRPPEEVEMRITLPCTMNGQIASGEENLYRFEARQGQRLVISTLARQLVPFIADAVPGWFQPVLTLRDAEGREVAYNDDYRFKPDPTILFEVPKDGEYVLSVTDAIYRGREDFVYRVTIGELPFVTSVFPLGGRVGAAATVEMEGWNLETAKLTPPGREAGPGVHLIAVSKGRLIANPVPFALDTLPEGFDKEPNNAPLRAQKVKLPIIINGRIDRPDDWDVFQVTGHAGDKLVAEVQARQLDSPLDSMLKITDAAGRVLAFNDDRENPVAGLNTHHADSYLSIQLPADGRYYVHLCDTARGFGDEYGYRLRVSMPRPDFALRVVPSSLSLRNRNTSPISVYAIRKDGFNGPIKLSLKEPPAGLSSTTVSLPANQDTVRLTLKCDRVRSNQPLNLTVEGRAKIGDGEIAREAAPAEDRMQAFLWRHLVPCEELTAMVYNPIVELSPKRVHVPPADQDKSKAVPVAPVAGKQTFTKQQVAGRLRQLRQLFDEWLITDRFYDKKVAECEAVRQ